jgi:hypothetical protein
VASSLLFIVFFLLLFLSYAGELVEMTALGSIKLENIGSVSIWPFILLPKESLPPERFLLVILWLVPEAVDVMDYCRIEN